MSTESDNKRYREALDRYKADRERIASILDRNQFSTIDQQDIIWLCQIANNGIDNKESAWHDHG